MPLLSTRIALGVWLLLLLGVFGRVLVQSPLAQSVVPIYLGAGERWVGGITLYHLNTGHDLYRNPPGVAALFAPLSLLPPKAGAVVWRVACIAVYLFGVRSLVRHVLPPLTPWRRAVVWVAAAVLAIPAINNGQVNLMIAAAALVGVGAAARGRWWAAAGWLAFAGWFKVYPLAVGLLCVMAAPRQLGWRLAVMTLALVAAPFLLQDPAYVWEQHRSFVSEMGRDDRTVSHVGLPRAPRDWTIVPRLAWGVSVPRVVSVAVGLTVAVGMAAAVWWASRRPHPPAPPTRRGGEFFLPLCLGLIWVTLFGPGTEMNTYSMLAAAAGAIAVTAAGWRRWPAWAGVGLLFATIVRASFTPEGPFPLIEAPAVAAALMLIALTSRDREGAGDANPAPSRSRLVGSHPG